MEVRRPHSTYQSVVQGKCPLRFLHFNGVVCSNTPFLNTSALTSSQLFRANSTCKGSRTPRLVEHIWVPNSRSCRDKRFVGTLPCPSFPWCFCFLGVFFAAKFLGLLSVFSQFYRVFKEGAYHRLHQNILRELVGVTDFTSVTPENSRGIYCVILMGFARREKSLVFFGVVLGIF